MCHNKFWYGKQDSAGSNLSIVFFFLLLLFFTCVYVWKYDETFVLSQHRALLLCQIN